MPSFETMMAKCRPHRVACGAFEQGHLDHDATNCLVQATFDGPVFEIPFYYSYLTRLPRVNRFADPSREEIIQLGKSEARFKLEYAKGFPSQRIFTNMIFANLRAKLTGDGSLTRTERMRLQTWTEFRQPQHKSPLASRIRDCENWKYWVECVRDFESRRLSG
jgi:hypothetical protein